jgi:hypothetical protein
MKEPDFLFSYVIRNVGFDVPTQKLNKFLDILVHGSSENAAAAVKSMLPRLKIFGKNIALGEIDENKIKEKL